MTYYFIMLIIQKNVSSYFEEKLIPYSIIDLLDKQLKIIP